MKRRFLLIFVFSLVAIGRAEYVDQTPNLTLNVTTNIYSLVGGTYVTGFDWFCQYAEMAWGGFADSIGGKPGFDSAFDYTDRCPTLCDDWAFYSNVTQLVRDDALDTAIADICDSLITAGWPADIRERLVYIHLADDSANFTFSNETRTVLGGSDSTCRFPMQLWDNTCPGDPNCPTGERSLTALDKDSCQTIISLANKKMVDNSATILKVTNQVKTIGWDNMLIGSGSGGCYGVNQASYWSAELNWDSGGTYPTDVEWDNIGRALVLDDFCDMKPGYYGVLEKTVDLFRPAGYRIHLNISNTPANNIKGYSQVADDSVAHFGMELRGNDLLYYNYTHSNFQLILNTLDTNRFYAPRSAVNIEYRMVISKYDDRDIFNPGTSGTQTIRWGEWTAERAYACQLCIQFWDSTAGRPLTTFSYGRAVFQNGDNKRWYELFEIPMGGTDGMRIDSVLSGVTVMTRKYDLGVAIYRPPDTEGGDTTGTVVQMDLGQDVYWIQADSTEALDSTLIEGGVVNVKSNYGYIYHYAGGEPPTPGKKARGIRK